MNDYDRAVAAAAHDYGTEEVRVTSKTGGEKGAKQARYDLIPADALDALARAYGKGESKYPTGEDHVPNYRKGYAWSLSFAALMRHAWAFWRGEDIDPESGTPHIISVAWHALALYQFGQDHPQYDDRPDVAIEFQHRAKGDKHD